MKKLFARVLAAAMLVSLFSANAQAASGYSTQTLEGYDGSKYSFSSAKVEKQDLAIDWVEGEPVKTTATVITMEPGSTVTISGEPIIYFEQYTCSADTGNYAILYNGLAGEWEGNRTYTTDELFGYSQYWDAYVVMLSYVESFDSQTGGQDAYIVLGDDTDQPQPEQPQQVFSDVAPTAWYAGFVQTVYEKGLFAGTGDGTFAPESNMEYAQFLTVLSQFSGDTITPVEGGVWYEGYVNWAKEKNLIPAEMLANFNPTAPITRQDMAALFGNFLGRYDHPGEPVTDEVPAFADADKVADYAAHGVTLFYQMGLMSGGDGNRFAPLATATRAQVAVTMVQMARVMGK